MNPLPYLPALVAALALFTALSSLAYTLLP